MSFTARLTEYRATLTEDFIPSLVAQNFVEMMEAQFPEEYDEWIRTHAIQFCTGQLTGILRSERHHTRKRARAFAQAAETGDVGVFTNVFEVNQDHTRRTVAAMRGPDHLYVADQYKQNGNRALLLAECHRQVATRIGDRRTDEVLTESEYLRIFQNAEAAPKSDDRLAALTTRSAPPQPAPAQPDYPTQP